MIYTAPCVMFLMRAECRHIARASGRGLVPGNLEFFGPQVALAYRLDAVSQDPKNSQFLGTPRSCPRNGYACIKDIPQGPYKS
jgi:hypothetical protein